MGAFPHADVVVVGAGFAGSVAAERLASAGKQVLVLDRRPHLGGNAHDAADGPGVLVHRYGPHIFHTNSERVFRYLSRFTGWRPYEHRVLASVEGELFPIPINRTTISKVYGRALDEEGVKRLLEEVREPRSPIRTSEDVVVDAVGRRLYELFFRGYTRKQWGLDPSQLDAQVTARVPVRTNDDDRYFTDRFQAMPRDGFTRMFQRMLDHPNIRVELGASWERERSRLRCGHLIYTGPIDAYFGHALGKLPYRSLRFEHEHLPATPRLQPVAVINHPGDVPYTRVTEFKHLTGQEHPGTSIVREYPQPEGDPYYPIPRAESAALHARYRELAARERGVTFVGRLAQYRYYNMDQAAAAGMEAAAALLGSQEEELR